MFHLNVAQQTLTRLMDMEVVKLTASAISLIECFILETYLVTTLVERFNVAAKELKDDFDFILHSLSEKGFNVNKHNLVATDGVITDLSRIWTPITAIVHIIQNCNSPCIICDCWKIKPKTYHDVSILKTFFLKLKERNIQTIMLSGGEPLLHPQLANIIQTLNKLDIGCELNTNGLLLHKNLWLLDYDIEEIVVSMDTTQASTYKTIRGVDKFELVWKNIYRLKNIKPEQNIGIRITLTKYILNNLQESIEFFLNKGVDFIGFSPLDVASDSFSRKNTNLNAAYLQQKLIGDKETLQTLKSTFLNENSKLTTYINRKYSEQKISWCSTNFLNCINYYLDQNNPYIGSENMCVFPLTSVVLDYNGDLKNCFYSSAFGNIYDPNNIDWKSTKTLTLLKNEHSCINCRGKVFCG